MSLEEDDLNAEEKKARIEALLRELYSLEHEPFLEIQFKSLQAMYQSYPKVHNVAGLTDTQRQILEEVIRDYNLEITFEEVNDGKITVTASHNSEPTIEDHLTIITDIILKVCDREFTDIEHAFLDRAEPDSPEPLLWTDVENA